jgi:succinate dehydrogenase/fumarate reductase flavoprotein subunit
MGGVRINGAAEVLRQGSPITGLFAAGEVTGGVHGSNRLAGNSLLECVVFGRIAGQRAASIHDGLCPEEDLNTTIRSVDQEVKGFRVRVNLPPSFPNHMARGTQIYMYGVLM